MPIFNVLAPSDAASLEPRVDGLEIDLTTEVNARLSYTDALDAIVKNSLPIGLNKSPSLEHSQNGFNRNSGVSFPNSLALAERNGTIQINGDVHMGGIRNIWRYTEDFSGSQYTATNITKDTATAINWKGINLAKLSGSNFYSQLNSNISGLGLNPYVIGAKYVVSGFVANMKATERFFWTRGLADSGANGHGAKFLDNNVRRFFSLLTATATNAPNPYWFFDGNGAIADAVVDLRIGGFQIERVPDDTKHGVAVIGDSTVAGGSGKKDLVTSIEWTRWAEGLMSIPFYNRGVGGEGTQSMIDRWVTDMTPLATDCKYAIIQGGINDLSALTDDQIVANLLTMHGLAIADGMIPIVCTITPCNKTGSEETKRTSTNTKIKNAFPLVLDLDLVVRDTSDSSKLKTAWYGDGVHFIAPAKRVIGEYVASWSGWDFVMPSPYQKVATTTATQAGDLYFDKNTFGPVLIDRTTGTKYRVYMTGGAIAFEIVP